MIPVTASPSGRFLSASRGQRLARAQRGRLTRSCIAGRNLTQLRMKGLEMRRDDARCRHAPCRHQAPDVPIAPANLDDINCDRYRSPGTMSCRVRAVSPGGWQHGSTSIVSPRIVIDRSLSAAVEGGRLGGPAPTPTDLRTSSPRGERVVVCNTSHYIRYFAAHVRPTLPRTLYSVVGGILEPDHTTTS